MSNSVQTPWPRRAALTAGVVLLLVAAAFGTRFGEDPGLVDSPLIGRTAPTFELEDLDDGEVWSSIESEAEVLVVNFWASWCVPCREEHPALTATARSYERQGVQFVGIVYQDSPDQAREFLDELGRGYPSLLDPDSRTSIDFGVFGIPETFFIADGTVVAKVTGAADEALLSSTLDVILSGGTPDSAERPGYQSQPR
ncbi:TlpA family protein disulfide reductase [Euzebya tangerina]|uniref:TlpA family protein disulfide reductase n=1 Tax=Euzebya tangerina TaxID=591198 RepID=UPI000E317F0E|nr:TlpA disulfide reductase family protein [Euzebya tangerina]